MRAIDAAEMHFPMKDIKEGEYYPPKPFGAKTVKQLLSEGLKPVSKDVISYYEMPYIRYGKRQAYAYVKGEDTEPFTPEDYADFEAKSKAKAELAAKEREERRAAKEAAREKEKEDERANILIGAAKASFGNVIVFDTETTGFSPAQGDELLQISIADKNSEILFNSYIKPLYKKSWPSSQNVHGISPFMVKDAPYPDKIRKQIVSLFENADAIVGHNVAFDIRFISQCLHINIPDEKVFDTMKLFRAADSKANSYSLDSAVKVYCSSFYEDFVSKAHDSSMDTRATAKVFMAFAEKGKELAKERGIDILTKTDSIHTVLKHEDSTDLDDDFSYFEIG